MFVHVLLLLLAPPLLFAEVNQLRCSAMLSVPAWVRVLCFEPDFSVVVGPSDSFADVALRFTVHADRERTRLACNDSLRVQFVSAKSLAAPAGAVAFETSCGRYEARFTVPNTGRHVVFTPVISVVHVNGEGWASPPTPRHFPRNLVDFKNDGPAVWNQPFVFDPSAHFTAKFARVPPHAPGCFGRFHSAQHAPTPASAVHLPRCTAGDAPGAWLVHTSMYADHPGEPFNWRPYECIRRRVTGPDLRGCLDAAGSVFFVGESTLQQLASLWEQHAHAQRFHWPSHISRPREYAVRHHNVVTMEMHGTELVLRHGLRDLVARAGAALARPRAYVFLQGANDAARDGVEATAANVERFAAELLSLLRNGTLPPPKHLVLVSPPVRHYKANGGPGQVVCGNITTPAPGAAGVCAMAGGGSLVRDGAGDVAWTVARDATAFRAFGTLARRAAIARHALGVWRKTFPAINSVQIPGFKTEGGSAEPATVALPPGEVVDFEALTAPLPTDYSYDGEHYVSIHDVWRHRRGMEYAGKTMATAEAANVLADLVC